MARVKLAAASAGNGESRETDVRVGRYVAVRTEGIPSRFGPSVDTSRLVRETAETLKRQEGQVTPTSLGC